MHPFPKSQPVVWDVKSSTGVLLFWEVSATCSWMQQSLSFRSTKTVGLWNYGCGNGAVLFSIKTRLPWRVLDPWEVISFVLVPQTWENASWAPSKSVFKKEPDVAS